METSNSRKLKRQKWTSLEDHYLISIMKVTKNHRFVWEDVSDKLSSLGVKKDPKQIHDRWTHHLNPEVNNKAFSKADNLKLFELHASLGCHWKHISEHFPGKTDNHIKNLFFAQIRKSLRKSRKLGTKVDRISPINSMKPKVLSNFVTREVLIPNNIWITGKPLPWLASNPISAKQFILYFTSCKISEVQTLNEPHLSRIIDYIFDYIEDMNDEYCHPKKSSKSQSVIFHKKMKEGQTNNSKSVRILGRDFIFNLKNAEKEIQMGTGKEDLVLSFKNLSENAIQISELLINTTDATKEVQELSLTFNIHNKVENCVEVPINSSPTNTSNFENLTSIFPSYYKGNNVIEKYKDPLNEFAVGDSIISGIFPSGENDNTREKIEGLTTQFSEDLKKQD